MDDSIASNRECRDWRHHFRPYLAWKIRGGWEEHRRCAQCGSIAIRILDRQGYQISRRIRYADGYLNVGGGRLTDADRAALRLAGVRNNLTGEQPSE